MAGKLSAATLFDVHESERANGVAKPVDWQRSETRTNVKPQTPIQGSQIPLNDQGFPFVWKRYQNIFSEFAFYLNQAKPKEKIAAELIGRFAAGAAICNNKFPPHNVGRCRCRGDLLGTCHAPSLRIWLIRYKLRGDDSLLSFQPTSRETPHPRCLNLERGAKPPTVASDQLTLSAKLAPKR